MPSTMAYRNGPPLWMTLPHMGLDVIVSDRTRQPGYLFRNGPRSALEKAPRGEARGIKFKGSHESKPEQAQPGHSFPASCDNSMTDYRLSPELRGQWFDPGIILDLGAASG